MQRLADLRPQLASVEQADACFDALARDTIELAKHEAACEHRIARLKTQLAEATAILRERIAENEGSLLSFVAARPELFENPRKRKTDFGSFGLQTATELAVSDIETVVETCLERGYDDCFKVVRTPIKTALQKRIAAGETFPGCTLKTGDTAVYKVDRVLLQNAKKTAE